MSGRAPAPDVARLFTAAEAIASIAMEHRPACGCDVCRAHAGDHEALARVLIALAAL
jgi:hypothetical protein